MTQKHSELPSFDFQLWLPSQVDTLGSFSDDLIKQFDSKSFVIKSQVMDALHGAPEDRQSSVTHKAPYRDDLTTTAVAAIDREDAEDTAWVDPRHSTLREEYRAHNMATREEKKEPLKMAVDRGLHKILKDTSETFLGSIGSADNNISTPVELDRHAYSQEADSTLSSIYSAELEKQLPLHSNMERKRKKTKTRKNIEEGEEEEKKRKRKKRKKKRKQQQQQKQQNKRRCYRTMRR
ncbi:hypothetical protein J3Q64DRAFT_1707139 [Phycomyces blakesleeanus]|uniref:Uncharacterized protein n=1 Tax=Phycomyces blakesleeanus TaxID=4837 RepID=A0ABR3BD32_PHYBL